MPFHHRILDFIGISTNTVILLPHPTAIGNFGEEIYFGLLKARREGKKLLVLQAYQLPRPLRLPLHNNREMIELQSAYRSPFHDGPFYGAACWLITLYFAFFRAIGIICRRIFNVKLEERYTIPMMGQETLWQPTAGTSNFSWQVVEQYKWPEQVREPIQLSLSRRQKSKAMILRQKMGLPADAWFACLHVRDGGYYGDHQVATTRNAKIENYIQAISEITGRGGWVVRLGDKSMPRLPSMERVIDYPFSDVKGTLMDSYLIKECRFYIGMLSGVLDLAMLFQRPIILTNMPNWLFAFPLKREDMGLFKHAYSKSEGRFVSPLEWPLLPWGGHADFSPIGNYEFHENTPAELRDAVAEYLDRETGWEPTPLQLEFNRVRVEQGRKRISQEMAPNDAFADTLIRYRLASRLESAAGSLSATFLERACAAATVT